MRIFFLRHGIAEDYSRDGTDRSRELTSDGIAQMREIGKTLKRLDLKVDRILASPYPRANKTAEIVAEAMGVKDRFHTEKRLAPGFRLGYLQEIIAENPGLQRLMLVAHNYDLPDVAGQLVGGAQIELKKGGLIRVDTDRIEPGAGRLVWVLTPGLLRKEHG